MVSRLASALGATKAASLFLCLTGDRLWPATAAFDGAKCPSGATVAQPICNRQVSGFESPLGLTFPLRVRFAEVGEVVSARLLDWQIRCATLDFRPGSGG